MPGPLAPFAVGPLHEWFSADMGRLGGWACGPITAQRGISIFGLPKKTYIKNIEPQIFIDAH